MKSSPEDEPFRLRLGAALKSRQEPYHRCLILSEPENNGGYIVLVRVTTDDGKWRDRDCILTPVDWPELDRNSAVAYSTAMCGRVAPRRPPRSHRAKWWHCHPAHRWWLRDCRCARGL